MLPPFLILASPPRSSALTLPRFLLRPLSSRRWLYSPISYPSFLLIGLGSLPGAFLAVCIGSLSRIEFYVFSYRIVSTLISSSLSTSVFLSLSRLVFLSNTVVGRTLTFLGLPLRLRAVMSPGVWPSMSLYIRSSVSFIFFSTS
jgi:hypothetical protein